MTEPQQPPGSGGVSVVRFEGRRNVAEVSERASKYANVICGGVRVRGYVCQGGVGV